MNQIELIEKALEVVRDSSRDIDKGIAAALIERYVASFVKMEEKPLRLADFVDADNIRPVFQNPLMDYDKKVAVASNGHCMLVSPADFVPLDGASGVQCVRLDDLKAKIDAKPYSYLAVIPSGNGLLPVPQPDPDEMRQSFAVAVAAWHLAKKSMVNAPVDIRCGGRTLTLTARYAELMSRIGTDGWLINGYGDKEGYIEGYIAKRLDDGTIYLLATFIHY